MDMITLTSPNTDGKAVHHAQQLLAKNKFGNFHTAEIDGIFGEETARSVKRAKYWLGYSESQLDPTFGNLIEALLEGKKELTPSQATRRNARLKADKAKPLREKTFATAVKSLGVKEAPANSNKVSFSKLYGMVGPWCAMFVTFCYVEAGSKSTFRKGRNWAFCPFMLTAAKAGRTTSLLRTTQSARTSFCRASESCRQTRGAVRALHSSNPRLPIT
jgi:peptidoglycan hydrolase-like protein with peptidoglycan-binding domain